MARSHKGLHHAPVLLSIMSEMPKIRNATKQMIPIFCRSPVALRLQIRNPMAIVSQTPASTSLNIRVIFRMAGSFSDLPNVKDEPRP